MRHCKECVDYGDACSDNGGVVVGYFVGVVDDVGVGGVGLGGKNHA